MHIGAAICFLLAFFFYSFAWTNVASGLAILGVVFEIAAWAIWLGTGKRRENQ